jgi:hypothetical protein
MKAGKTGVSMVIPMDIWRSMTEIRLQLDSYAPGPPTPIEEALREIVRHYDSCPRVEGEAGAFAERAKAWKGK